MTANVLMGWNEIHITLCIPATVLINYTVGVGCPQVSPPTPSNHVTAAPAQSTHKKVKKTTNDAGMLAALIILLLLVFAILYWGYRRGLICRKAVQPSRRGGGRYRTLAEAGDSGEGWGDNDDEDDDDVELIDESIYFSSNESEGPQSPPTTEAVA